jgi:predicted Rossmann fold nucleotide-binding protein DprA/Smf involved in DNA uptake
MAWQISEESREVGKKVGIVGARALPEEFKPKINEIVRYLVRKEYQIHTGGALGADLYALEALIALAAVQKGQLFSPWSSIQGFPREVQKHVEYYVEHRGKVFWGLVPAHSSRSVAIAGLLSRNQRLVNASSGIVAFLYGESKGTINTIRIAIQRGLKVVVFVCGGNAKLPEVSSGRWVALRCLAPWEGAYMFKR